MLASYRVHEISSRDALTPGLSVLRTKVFRSLIACKTFYHQTCAKTSPILLFGHAALPPRIPKQFLSISPARSIDPRTLFSFFTCYSLAACVGTFSTLGPIHTVWIFTNSRMP